MIKILREYIELVLEAWKRITMVMFAVLVFGAPFWAFIALVAWLVIP